MALVRRERTRKRGTREKSKEQWVTYRDHEASDGSAVGGEIRAKREKEESIFRVEIFDPSIFDIFAFSSCADALIVHIDAHTLRPAKMTKGVLLLPPAARRTLRSPSLGPRCIFLALGVGALLLAIATSFSTFLRMISVARVGGGVLGPVAERAFSVGVPGDVPRGAVAAASVTRQTRVRLLLGGEGDAVSSPFRFQPGGVGEAGASGGGNSAPQPPRVLVLTPVKNAAGHLDRYFSLLLNLTRA
jgi:hypothetical protein